MSCTTTPIAPAAATPVDQKFKQKITSGINSGLLGFLGGATVRLISLHSPVFSTTDAIVPAVYSVAKPLMCLLAERVMPSFHEYNAQKKFLVIRDDQKPYFHILGNLSLIGLSIFCTKSVTNDFFGYETGYIETSFKALVYPRVLNAAFLSICSAYREYENTPSSEHPEAANPPAGNTPSNGVSDGLKALDPLLSDEAIAPATAKEIDAASKLSRANWN